MKKQATARKSKKPKTSKKSSATLRLINHFVRSGVSSRDARRLTEQIHKWIKSSGVEWTVDRLKAMKIFALQTQAGNADYKPGWIATHKDGTFKGPFRVIGSLTFPQQLACLNAASAIKLKDMSRNQIAKTRKSISDPWVAPTTEKFVERAGSMLRNNAELRTFRSIKPNYKRMIPGGLTTAKPGTFYEGWVGSFIQGLYNPLVADFLEKKFGFDSSVTFVLEPAWDDMVMASPGAIHCIQEKGAKARVVAMPNSALQTCLRPMHKALNIILDQLDTDCTFNQDEGAEFALRQLRDNKKVFSVDLSSATDRFPRHVQLQVLEALGWHDEARLFKRASEGHWRLTESFGEKLENEYLTYSVGQPMGLYGSFALFALTHNVLLRTLCSEMGLSPVESFRVLGDDVIISDDNLHTAYRRVLTNFEVPVSESKTIQSDLLAEFAGYVIHKDLGSFKPPKVPSVDGRNFLAYVKAFGFDAIKDLPSKTRKVARIVAELPVELGGLGLNPKGKPLLERLEPLTLNDGSVDVVRFSLFGKQLNSEYCKRKFTGQEAECEVIEFLYDQYKECIDSEVEKSLHIAPNLLAKVLGPKNNWYRTGDYARLLELSEQMTKHYLQTDKYHPSNARVWDDSSEVERPRDNQSHLSDLDQWKRKIRINNESDPSP